MRSPGDLVRRRRVLACFEAGDKPFGAALLPRRFAKTMVIPTGDHAPGSSRLEIGHARRNRPRH
jgi:hypothetical protein